MSLLVIRWLKLALTLLTSTATTGLSNSIDTTIYHNYTQLRELFRSLESSYSSLAKLHSIGQSVQQRELYVLQVTANVGKERAIGRPMFKWVGNMHGDEAVGRQMTIFMAEYLVTRYGHDERITRLLNTTEIWLMPSLNPDGFAASREGDCGYMSSCIL